MPIVKMPDGQEVDMPDNPSAEQLAALEEINSRSTGKPPGATPGPTQVTTKPRRRSESDDFEGAGRAVLGLGDAALAAGTGAATAVAGGLAGAARAAGGMIAGQGVDKSLQAGADVVRKVGSYAYEPRTDEGKAITKMAQVPMEVVKGLTGEVGADMGRSVGNEAMGETIGEIVPEIAATVMGMRAGTKPMAPAAPVPGRDFSPLRKMTPEQEGRFFDQKSQGVEPTLGSVTRESPQFRYEQTTAQLPGGEKLAQRNKDNDAALTASVERIKLGPEIKGHRDLNEVETGRAIRTALEKKADAKWKEVNGLYEEARSSGDTKKPVDISPLIKYLDENEAAAIAVKELKSIEAGVKKLVPDDDTKPGAPVGSGRVTNKMKQQASTKEKTKPMVTIDDLEFLRQEAGKLSQRDGSAKSYMTEVRKIIDGITEGQGGEKYQAARKSRKEWGDEFEERVGVADLIDKPTRTDYKVAVEDVWDHAVVKGSIHELQSVVDSLRTSKGDQLADSKQALKDMQARTVDHIIEKSTENGTFSPAAFKKTIRSIGNEKLELLLGKDAVRGLELTMKNAKDTKTQPTRAPGSDTELIRQTMISRMASSHLEHLFRGWTPKIVSRTVGAIRDKVMEGGERARAAAQVDEALTPRRAPAAETEQAASRVLSDRRAYLMSEAAKRTGTITPAAVAAQEDQ